MKAVWSLNNGQKKTMHVSSPLAHAMPCLPSLSFLSPKLAIRFWREWADLRNNKVALGNLQECGESLEPGSPSRPLVDGDRLEMGEVVFAFKER